MFKLGFWNTNTQLKNLSSSVGSQPNSWIHGASHRAASSASAARHLFFHAELGRSIGLFAHTPVSLIRRGWRIRGRVVDAGLDVACMRAAGRSRVARVVGESGAVGCGGVSAAYGSDR